MTHTTTEEFDELCKSQKTIYTSCKGCVFFKDFDDENHPLEEHCFAGRLKKFGDLGCEIVNIKDSDEEASCKAIKGRVCNMLRGEVWSMFVNRDVFKFSENLTDDEKLSTMKRIAEKECEVRCSIVVYMPKKSGVDLEARFQSLRDTLLSIKNGQIQPEHIVLVNNASIMPSAFMPRAREIFNEIELSCTWNMEYILDEDEGYNKDYHKIDLPGKITNLSENEQSYENCIDIALKKIKSQYVAIFFDGSIVPSNFISSINESINNGMDRFILVLPDDNSKSGTIIQMMAFKQLKGNREIDFVNKALSQVREQKCEYMIKSLSQILAPQE